MKYWLKLSCEKVWNIILCGFEYVKSFARIKKFILDITQKEVEYFEVYKILKVFDTSPTKIRNNILAMYNGCTENDMEFMMQYLFLNDIAKSGMGNIYRLHSFNRLLTFSGRHGLCEHGNTDNLEVAMFKLRIITILKIFWNWLRYNDIIYVPTDIVLLIYSKFYQFEFFDEYPHLELSFV